MKTYRCKYPDPVNPGKLIIETFQAPNINEAAKIVEGKAEDLAYWVEEILEEQ